MARGWESKSVAEQVEQAQASTTQGDRRRLTAQEAATQRCREVMQAARARVLQQLQTTSNLRYRRLLEQELASLEASLNDPVRDD